MPSSENKFLDKNPHEWLDMPCRVEPLQGWKYSISMLSNKVPLATHSCPTPEMSESRCAERVKYTLDFQNLCKKENVKFIQMYMLIPC